MVGRTLKRAERAVRWAAHEGSVQMIYPPMCELNESRSSRGPGLVRHGVYRGGSWCRAGQGPGRANRSAKYLAS
jgi:hypothetical protein